MQNLVNVRDFSGSVQEGDWAPAFADAIAVAAADGRGGVFVPADTDAYTVAKPGPQRPSIDLRGARDFMLVGEGPGSVIQMAGSGGGGSWHMIHIGGHAANITVRDLFLDGNRSGLDQLDTQTHLIKLGGSNKISGGADNVKIHNCTLTRSFGDGIAILPTAGDLDDNADEKVSNVQIAFCSFIDNNRSGISNQRSTDLIEILYNYFEGNSDQDIDFEPTGGILGSGPRRYIILGNTILHSKPTTCVTLSGVSGDIPASDNIFAYNQLHGGRLGLVDAGFTSIVGNFVVGGPTDPGAVVRLTGKVEGVRLAGNHIVRPAGALPGQLLAVSSAPAELTFESTREPPAGSDVDVTDDELGIDLWVGLSADFVWVTARYPHDSSGCVVRVRSDGATLAAFGPG